MMEPKYSIIKGLYSSIILFFPNRYLLNPSLDSEETLASFKFLGILLGVAIRTKKPLDLHLAPCVWKLLAGVPLRVDDIEEVGPYTTTQLPI